MVGGSLKTLVPAFVAGLATAFLLVTCGGCGPRRDPLGPDLPVPSVVRLKSGAIDSEVLSFSCSAFKLGEDLVGTAGHCCEPDTVYSLGESGAEATVLVDDDAHDVCIMRGRIPGATIRMGDHDPALGEAVYNMGFPSGTQVISRGHWSGRDPQNDNYGVCSVVVRGGSSGSPILNMRDELVGILVATYRGGDSISFVANIEHVRFALAKALRMH
jgi:S1-C subfamily serine protease